MSLQFFGWEVIYDDSSSIQLGPSQAPKDRGIYTMYHGTTVASAQAIIAGGFQQSSDGLLGKGVYVSRDKNKAARYPLNCDPANKVILELRVRVGRVKRIDKDHHPLRKTWSTQGYDTAWVPPNCGMKAVPSGLEEDCVFDPKRVKVLAIAQAPNTVLSELQKLLATNLKISSGSSKAVDTCSLCKRKVDLPHIKQQCWSCGNNICIFMTKHYCTGNN